MKKWMVALTIALAALSGSAEADSTIASNRSCSLSYGQPYHQGGCCGSWEFEGQALYWRASVNNDVYGFVRIVRVMELEDNFQVVKAGNDWGFRIKGEYTTCDGCAFASLSYLYFDQLNRATVSAVNNITNSYFFGDVSAAIDQITSEYRHLDGRVGYYICRGCRGAWYGYGGISWIYLRNHQQVEGFIGNQEPVINQHNRYSAAGFETGIGGYYQIWCGFGLAAELGGVAAIGEQANHLSVHTNDPSVEVIRSHKPSATVCVSGLEAKLEAFYECCWCGFSWGFMVGYEQHYYFNPFLEHAITSGIFPESGSLSFRNRDFGVGGLYFGAKVGY